MNMESLPALSEYLADPCGTASIPYWKCKSLTVPENMWILHSRDYQELEYPDYTAAAYFRLKHNLKDIMPAVLPVGFTLCDATEKDFAAHICSCYETIGITEDQLTCHRSSEVYDPQLWLAVKEDNTGMIAATAIADLDRNTREGILEWIQVSANVRRRGLGRFLVLELLNRLRSRADFVSVSGQCTNPSNPEALYRSCGFSGTDVWYILKKHRKNSQNKEIL